MVYEFLRFQNEHRHVQFIPPDKFNAYICQFLVSVTKKNDEEYEPTSLRSFISSIDRQLRSSGSEISVIADVEFAKCREVLKSKQKSLKKQGLGNKPNAAGVLSDEHLQKMYDARTFGDKLGTSSRPFDVADPFHVFRNAD